MGLREIFNFAMVSYNEQDQQTGAREEGNADVEGQGQADHSESDQSKGENNNQEPSSNKASHSNAQQTYVRLRENRSRPQTVNAATKKDKYQQFQLDARTRSMQESELQLALQMKEQSRLQPDQKRSISFNGLSVVIDALTATYAAISSHENPLLVEAIKSGSMDKVNTLVSQNMVQIKDALFKCIDEDKPSLLRELISEDPSLVDLRKENGESLLHRAASVGSMQCVQLLIDMGADPNKTDKTGHAGPLHYAVRAGDRGQPEKHKTLIEYLINNGTDINGGRLKASGSVLHAAVEANNTTAVDFLLGQNVETAVPTFMPTALHTAAEHNMAEVADLLLKREPMLVHALQGEKARYSALHVASENGYLEVARVLLDRNADVTQRAANDVTALHLAAKSMNDLLLKLLLEKARNVDIHLINSQDSEGRTPLLIATSGQGIEVKRCMTLLLDFGADVDLPDHTGYTPLHKAAIFSRDKRVNLLIERDADITIKNNEGQSALYFIRKKVPQCMKFIEERMDTGMKSENNGMIKLDFTKLSRSITGYRHNMTFFSELMNSPHQGILKHPLSQAFLYLKWNEIKLLYILVFVITHLVFSIVATTYALLVFVSLCHPPTGNETFIYNRSVLFAMEIECDTTKHSSIKRNLVATFWIFLILCIIIYVTKEIIKLTAKPRSYFRQLESLHDFIIIGSTICIISINPRQDKFMLARFQYHLACIMCFSTWLYMMFLIGRVPRFGKYVQMFKTVALSVGNFMVAYVFLLMAFAFAFMIAFPDDAPFSSVHHSMVKLIVMMLGEVNYEEMYYSEREFIKNNTIESEVLSQPFPGTSHVLLFMFIVLVSIILMNLLVGLAVSDIQGLEKSAKLHQLFQQIHLINYVEAVLFSPYFQIFPNFVQNFLRTKLQGQVKTIHCISPNDINDKSLPESLKRTIQENCFRRHSKYAMFSRRKEMDEMKKDIQRILQYLEGRDVIDAKPEPEPPHGRPSILSNGLSSLYVEEDLDSDLDLNDDLFNNRGSNALQYISEETEWRMLRDPSLNSIDEETGY